MAIWTLLICLMALLSGACSNLVFSDRPLFADDPAAHPVYRPGLWMTTEPKCRFDESRPLSDWPSCANGELFDEKGGVDGREREPQVTIAGGEPLILQMNDEGRPAEPPKNAPDIHGSAYSYLAMTVTARDDLGRASAITVWWPQCGPPSKPHPIPGHRDKSTATRHPFPGLTMAGENCRATDAEAVRNAARRSKAFGTLSMHWVRDADPPLSTPRISR